MKNNKVIMVIIGIIAIVVLAVLVGVNASKKDTTTTSANQEDRVTPSPEVTEETPIVEETLIPEETPVSEETPTMEETLSSPNVTQPTDGKNEDISSYTSSQKEEYAKKLVKENWSSKGLEQKVYYSCENIESNGKYTISVRDEATTAALAWYKVDINNKTCTEI